MKSILKAIRAVLRAMKKSATTMMRKTVEIGGRLVSVLAPGPAMTPKPDFEPADADSADEASGPDYAFENAIYKGAVELLGGGMPSLETTQALTIEHMRWLAAMSDEMLRKVLTSQPHQVRDHRANRRSIRGVLRYEKQAIDDYLDAIAREKVEGQEPEPELASSWAMA